MYVVPWQLPVGALQIQVRPAHRRAGHRRPPHVNVARTWISSLPGVALSSVHPGAADSTGACAQPIATSIPARTDRMADLPGRPPSQAGVRRAHCPSAAGGGSIPRALGAHRPPAGPAPPPNSFSRRKRAWWRWRSRGSPSSGSRAPRSAPGGTRRLAVLAHRAGRSAPPRSAAPAGRSSPAARRARRGSSPPSRAARCAPDVADLGDALVAVLGTAEITPVGLRCWPGR